MWRFKQFMPKEPAGLEGRTVDIGNLKIQVRNAIAEGGFSCVYLARDAMNLSRQYALKHMICNDEESLDLVRKEISVLKLLKGHPNVVTLAAHSIFDLGRTKEAFLVMEFCEKSLVSVLESRGAGYFEEKQILLIFRDVCDAVFAMHCLSPPIAHRDLKAENVLLGHDGAWKLCDFGSTSTNHKRFDRPEEMGIEEDNIRKHTTPAYRAPEMWDLFRREIISEKVDIWALGCLLYRICYLKSAFDGESKLQILNGNYRIPSQPSYSSSIVDLIKDMLQASPDARPDITQVWFRVNELLPLELQKHTPDRPISMVAAETNVSTADAHDEGPVHAKRAPRRAPPAPPSGERVQNVSPSSLSTKETQQARSPQGAPKVSGGGSPIGSFWSTQHAKDSLLSDESGPVFDEDSRIESTLRNNRQSPESHRYVDGTSSIKGNNVRAGHQSKSGSHGSSVKGYDKSTEDFEIRFYSEDKNRGSEKTKLSNVGISTNDAFNTFVADFDNSRLSSGTNRTGKEELEAEMVRLRGQLRQANLEKAEITSKYEKLSAICRSQRQEIQELKQALAAGSPSPKLWSSPGSSQGTQREKVEGSVWEFQQGMVVTSNTPIPEPTPWKAFSDEPKASVSPSQHPKSVRTTNGSHNKKVPPNPAPETWGFGSDSFTATPAISSMSFSSEGSQRSSSQKHVDAKTVQPAGWAGF